MLQVKACKKCLKEKAYNEFRRKKSHLCGICLDCERAISREYQRVKRALVAPARINKQWNPGGLKICNKCKVEFPVDSFYVRRDHIRKDREPVRNSVCKPCSLAISRAWRIKTGYKNKKRPFDHKKAWYEKRIFKLYGVTKEQYDRQLIKRGGLCAICGNLNEHLEFALSIDHSHSTGAFRGLLCRACNKGLGFFRDNSHLLREAARYLEGQTWALLENCL